MAKHRPLSSVLIKPTGPDCNLDCTYCFYLEKEKLFPETKVHRMTPEIQEYLIQQVIQQSDYAEVECKAGSLMFLMTLLKNNNLFLNCFFHNNINLEQNK